VLKQKIKDVEKMTSPHSSQADRDSIRDKLAFWMQSVFDKVLGPLILANTIMIFVQLEHQSHEVRASLEMETQSWTHANLIFSVFDYVFCAIFITELLVRLYIERWDYCRSWFNLLDLIVVPLMTVDALLGDVGPDLSIARTTRVLRVIRALQLIRSLSHCRHLRILWNTIAASVAPFIYSMTALFIFMVMLTILLTQTLQDFTLDESNDIAHRQWVYKHYGDGFRSLWTVFELTFSGCWPNYARRIIEEVSPWYSLFYFVYVYVVVFVATRIVAALFMKETLTQYANDAETMVKERAKKSTWIKHSLSDLFEEADTNGDGCLTEDEMRALFAHPKVMLWLKELGLDASDSDALIDLIDEKDGWSVNRDDFVHGITRLRGEARSQDVVVLHNNVKRLRTHVREIRHSLDSLVQANLANLCKERL